jgi:hypothetical protein
VYCLAHHLTANRHGGTDYVMIRYRTPTAAATALGYRGTATDHRLDRDPPRAALDLRFVLQDPAARENVVEPLFIEQDTERGSDLGY